MRTYPVALAMLFVILSGARVWAEPVVMLDGTPVVLQVVTAVTAGSTAVGTTVKLIIRDAKFTPEGGLLIGPGGVAQAVVTASEAPRLIRRKASLGLKMSFVSAADGTRLLARILPAKEFEGSKRSSLTTSPSLVPLLDIDGTDITLPKGAEFVAYIDTDQKVEAQAGPEIPQPLIVKGTKSLPDGKGGVLTAVTLANPNPGSGLLNATVVLNAMSPEGKPVGTNLDGDPVGLEHRIVALRPGEMRTFLKRVPLKGSFAKCTTYVAQPWEPWAQPGVADLPVLYSQWQDATTVTGMIRNNQSWPARVEVVVVVPEAEGIASFGRAVIKRVAPGETPKFTVPMLGSAAMGTAYEIYALGAALPGK